MKLIDNYVAASILRTALPVAGVAMALSLVGSFIGEVGKLGENQYGGLAMLAYIVLRIPDNLRPVMPVIALLAALVTLGGMAAGSELTVVRSAGVSVARLGWSVVRAGLLLALVTALLGEWVAPNAMRIGEQLRQTALHGPGAQSIDGGLWLRNRGNTIRIGGILVGNALVDVSIYTTDGHGRLKSVLRAASARRSNGVWTLHNLRRTTFHHDSVSIQRRESLPWHVDLPAALVRLSRVRPQELSGLGLYRFIAYLRHNNVAAGEYRLVLWQTLVAPFTVIVLAVLALPFAFGPLRGNGAGQRLLIGGLAGLVFFIVNEIAASSGQVYGLPPWLAAGWPTCLLGMGIVAWLWRLR